MKKEAVKIYRLLGGEKGDVTGAYFKIFNWEEVQNIFILHVFGTVSAVM